MVPMVDALPLGYTSYGHVLDVLRGVGEAWLEERVALRKDVGI